MTRLAAAGLDGGESRVHIGKNALVYVEFEAEIPADRDQDGGGETPQDFQHRDGSIIVVRTKCHIVGRGSTGVWQWPLRYLTICVPARWPIIDPASPESWKSS